jgi:hypothetical protein
MACTFAPSATSRRTPNLCSSCSREFRMRSPAARRRQTVMVPGPLERGARHRIISNEVFPADATGGSGRCAGCSLPSGSAAQFTRAGQDSVQRRTWRAADGRGGRRQYARRACCLRVARVVHPQVEGHPQTRQRSECQAQLEARTSRFQGDHPLAGGADARGEGALRQAQPVTPSADQFAKFSCGVDLHEGGKADVSTGAVDDC